MSYIQAGPLKCCFRDYNYFFIISNHLITGTSCTQLEGALVRVDVRQAAVLQVRRRQTGLVSARENPAEGL